MIQSTQMSAADVKRRYPRLVSAVVAQSSGYFSEESAANAIAAHKSGEPFWCEWYLQWAAGIYRQLDPSAGRIDGREVLRIVGRTVLSDAFRYCRPRAVSKARAVLESL